MTQYVCTQLVQTPFIYRGYREFDCKNWQELQIEDSTPLLPELTKEQINAITLEIIGVMVLVWGWNQVINFIKGS